MLGVRNNYSKHHPHNTIHHDVLSIENNELIHELLIQELQLMHHLYHSYLANHNSRQQQL